MKKQFFVAAMALVLGAGFTACSSDDLNVKPGTEANQKATTYMSVSFVLPTANSTRAADDGQDENNPKFNNVGKWAGKDDIKKVNVYVFDNTGALEANPTYTTAQLSFTQVSTGADQAKVSANTAFKVKPGAKTVYVVVNPTTAAENLLNIAVNNTLATFKAAYESANLAFANHSVRTTYTTDDETNAGELAKVDGGKDVILMTGKAAEPTIVDNVSAAEAVSGIKNRADLTVQRAVARVLVTTTATSFDLKGINPNDGSIDNAAIKVSDLTYVVGQGENKFYFLQKEQSPANTDGAAFTTPAFAKVPSGADYWTTDYQLDYATVGKNYDYSGLWKNTATGNIKGVSVPTRAAFDSNAANELTNVTTDLNAGLKGEFILPTLHKYSTTRAQSNYRKGNTAYILVRGYLTPKYVVDATGNVVAGTTLGATDDVYLGANGVFYADKNCVQDPAKKGVTGQTAQLYKGRKVMYFVWINPDNLTKAVNSPVIRNNIYHVQIKGISKVGANWNPLVPTPNTPNTPGQPIDPNTPGNPINNNPNNPDPRPDNPLEPKTPPVDPTDPISNEETWMSVNVNILPWAVHSYEVELSI